MIEIREMRAIRGPNRYSRFPVIFMVLDIGDYELRPSDKIEGFRERLLTLLPTLQDHECSVGKPGGFVQRVERGTWAGHIIEHIAIELQCLAGMEVAYGKTRETTETGVYLVSFRYLVESAGMLAAKSAVAIFEALSHGHMVDLPSVISQLKVLRENDMLGPTTWGIVREAKSRGIPFIRLNKDNYIQLGFGLHQKRIQASITGETSAIAVEIADDKSRTKEHLRVAGIPVPEGRVVLTEEEAVAAFDSIGSPVVIKPNIGNHGRGATINVTQIEQVAPAFHLAREIHSEVIIEEYITGFDFRLLVIDGKFVAAAKREPAHVIGDGASSVAQLIETTNKDPRRGFGHEKVLTQIEVDDITERLLSQAGMTLDSAPGNGQKIYLKATANLSKGGTATDVTDEVSPSIQLMAERTARSIGLDCVGIDVLCSDVSLPLKTAGIKVVEVNAAPGLRMHLEPTHGKPRNVAKPLIDKLFPIPYIDVPVLAVTGTNGKTTTCKLLTHTLKYSGKSVGLACTTGIEIDGISILTGDYSGPTGAGIVMREPTVDHIVLEVARGGIVRRGLGVEEVDVGILLNIGTDHLGSDWIETQEDLNLVKSTVIEVVKETGTSVLNADDQQTMSVLERARGQIILFSRFPESSAIQYHIEQGGTAIVVVDRSVLIRKRQLDVNVCTLDEIPITFGGIVDFNVSNALAAIGALHGLSVPIEQIRNGLRTFYPSSNQNPGRMNLLDFQKFKVLVDYGHNSDAARAIARLLPRLSQGRKIGLCHGTGSRTDEQIVEHGVALASVYDYVFLADFDPRHREIGVTQKLIREGLLKGGFQSENIELVGNLENALDLVFSKAEVGDLLVIQPDELEPLMSQIIARHRKLVELG